MKYIQCWIGIRIQEGRCFHYMFLNIPQYAKSRVADMFGAVEVHVQRKYLA